MESQAILNFLNYISKYSQVTKPRFSDNLHTQASVSFIFRVKKEHEDLVNKFFQKYDLFQNNNNKHLQLQNQEVINSIILNSANLMNNLVSQISNQTNIFEILMIKRQINEKDKHSGQIAFPGGKNENMETDLQAAIRETQEEIGFDLTNTSNFIYLGTTPLNYFAYFRKNKKTMLSVQFFFMKNRNIQEIVNQDEVAKAFWIDLNYFLFPIKDRIYLKALQRLPSNVFINQSSFKHLFQNYFYKNYAFSKSCHYLLPNQEEMFGLSFLVMSHVLRIMTMQGSYQLIGQLGELKFLLDTSSKYEFHYSKPQFFKQKIVNRIYYNRRMKQFTRIFNINKFNFGYMKFNFQMSLTNIIQRKSIQLIKFNKII